MALTTFVAGNVLTAAQLNDSYAATGGLRLVTKQTIGSGVSTVSVTSAFNANFDAYKIVISGGGCNYSGTITFQLSGLTTGYYGNLIYANYSSATPSSAGYSNIASITHAGGTDSTSVFMNMDVINPFLAKQTYFTGLFLDASNAGTFNAKQTSATSATGFTLTPVGGTLTGGTIYVYGYSTTN